MVRDQTEACRQHDEAAAGIVENHQEGVTMGRSITETRWMQYIRAVGIGSGPDASCAKLVLQVPGASPCMTMKKAREWLRIKRLDSSGYRQLVGSVERLQDMWRRGMHTHLEHVEDSAVWDSLGDNRHRKRTYL
jgi:hypothetical protein